MFGNTVGSRWVGRLRWGDKVELVLLTQETDQPAVLDRPANFQFNLPVTSLSADLPSLRFRTDTLTFEGTANAERGWGAVREGDTVGGFEFRPQRDLSTAEFRRFIGHYRLTPDDDLMVSQDARPEEHLYFYLDGDTVVRLYPLNATTFWSERGETVTFVESDNAVQALRREDTTGTVSDAPRIDWDREVEVTIPVGDYHLGGTLLLPPGPDPHPAVMLVHHANTHQRDYYRLFAEAFVQEGVAAFIYDKRGWGESTGERLASQIYDLAEDAEAVFRALQRHPDLKADAIGIWGISNGAWVGPLVASRVGDAAVVIGASIAGVTPAEQERVRRGNVVRELGASPRAAALIDRLWEHLFRFYVEGGWTSELEAILTEVNTDEELQALPKYPGHHPGLQPVPPIYPFEELQAEGGTWRDGGFDPEPIYAGLTCPILCVWGADDVVVPLRESVQRIESALQASYHPRSEVHVLPNTTHQLYVTSPQPTGIPAGTMHTRLHHVALAPSVRTLMARWAAQRVQAI